MKIYLAGPMRGIPDHNYPAFDAVAALVAQLGHISVSPADLDRQVDANWTGPRDRGWTKACQIASHKELLDSDGMVLLPGWQRSEGVEIERRVARYLRIPVARVASDLNSITPEYIVGIIGDAKEKLDVAAEIETAGYHRLAYTDPVKAAILASDVYINGGARLNNIVRVAGWDRAIRAPSVARQVDLLDKAMRLHLGQQAPIEAWALHARNWVRLVVPDVTRSEEIADLESRNALMLRLDQDIARPVINAYDSTDTNYIDVDVDAPVDMLRECLLQSVWDWESKLAGWWGIASTPNRVGLTRDHDDALAVSSSDGLD